VQGDLMLQFSSIKPHIASEPFEQQKPPVFEPDVTEPPNTSILTGLEGEVEGEEGEEGEEGVEGEVCESSTPEPRNI